MNELIQKLENFYRDLEVGDLDQLSDLYAENIEFVDPVAKHTGISQVSRYFEDLMQTCDKCHFEFLNSGDANGTLFVEWRMDFAHPKLKSGHMLSVEGVSLIKQDNGKIIYQRDFYDLGQMLYEHIPLLGWMVRKLKQRLAK